MHSARHVTLGTGQQIGLGQYVAAIKLAKANRDHIFEPGLASAWPATGAEIVQEFRRGVQDRINLRGRLNIRSLKPMSDDRKYRHLARTQKCQCRMCGASISWKPMHGRFCDACCRNSCA